MQWAHPSRVMGSFPAHCVLPHVQLGLQEQKSLGSTPALGQLQSLVQVSVPAAHSHPPTCFLNLQPSAASNTPPPGPLGLTFLSFLVFCLGRSGNCTGAETASHFQGRLVLVGLQSFLTSCDRTGLRVHRNQPALSWRGQTPRTLQHVPHGLPA